MRRTLTLVATLLAVVGVASANNLKNKLVQQKAKELSESSATMDYNWDGHDDDYQPDIKVKDCNCTFTPLPCLGEGCYEGFAQQAVVCQEANLVCVPDTQYTQICQSECSECENEAHASCSVASKNRTFTISGSICVLETVDESEQGHAKENSKGNAQKKKICQTNNKDDCHKPDPKCVSVKVCPSISLCPPDKHATNSDGMPDSVDYEQNNAP
jgi:hypothetical protein